YIIFNVNGRIALLFSFIKRSRSPSHKAVFRKGARDSIHTNLMNNTISIIFGQIFHRECKKVKKTAFHVRIYDIGG
ncbi:MAG: hypothetical protein WAX20_06325, partial [Enterococcus aquimarinus]